MPKRGALTKCFCSECAQTDAGYTWRSVSGAADHRDRDKQREWIRARDEAAAIAARYETGSSLEYGLGTNPPEGESGASGTLNEPLRVEEHRAPSLPRGDSDSSRSQRSDVTMHSAEDPPRAASRSPINSIPPSPQSPPDRSRATPAQTVRSPQAETRPGSPLADLQVEYSEEEDESMYNMRYAAANDPPYLRLAYLNAMVSSVVYHNSNESVNTSLRGTVDCLRLAGALPDHVQPRVTVDSVRSRLGLDTDLFIIRQPICSICFTPYSLDDIRASENPQCTYVSARTHCKGIIWISKISNGTEKRCPPRYVCYTRLKPAFRRMWLRSSFVRAFRAGKEAHSNHTDGVLHDVCCGVVFQSARIGRRRVFCADGSVRDEAQTGDSEKRLIDMPYGMILAINLDWFRSTPKGLDSTGAIYLTIQNLDRSVRFLPANVILACVVPGPKEPPLEQLNLVLKPIVEQLKELYAGVVMKIYNENLPAMVYGGLIMDNSDSQARCKAQGTPGHAHDTRFCRCESEQRDINTPKGYDREQFVMVDNYLLLEKAFESKLAKTKTQRAAIHKEFGIRWSELNELPDWKPHGSAPTDPMHNLYLGIVNDLWDDVLVGGCYFTAAQKRSFDEFMAKFEWPSHIGRLPKNLCERGGVRKADEWRRLISILPIVLWEVWRDPQTDTIPLVAPPIHDLVAKPPTFQRSCARLYDIILLLASACRIFASWAIHPTDVHRAQQYLQLYCQRLRQMGVPLKPNHHYSMHYEDHFQDFGPFYAWWLFSHERFNGLQEKVKINNKSEEISSSLMRYWNRLHRLHEMVENLPEDSTDEERAAIAQLCFSKPNRGTLLAQAAHFTGDTEQIRTPRYSQKVDLRRLGPEVYESTLEFARQAWPHLNLQHDRCIDAQGMLFLSARVAEQLDFIHKSGIRYGSSSSRRTHADRYILARFGNELTACCIERHLKLTVGDEAPILAVAVRCFVTSNDLPTTPWDMHVGDLGYYVGLANQLSALEVIATNQIFSPVGLATISICDGRQLWVAVSYDRTGDEVREDDAGFFDELEIE